MIVIVCLDDDNGMLFNKRRQSRDQKVIEDISGMTETIWMNAFSEKLFAESALTVNVDACFLSEAEDGEYCFVENERILSYVERVEQIVVYKWNRKYPSDFKFDVSLRDWKLAQRTEFAGSSHERITKEIYVRA